MSQTPTPNPSGPLLFSASDFFDAPSLFRKLNKPLRPFDTWLQDQLSPATRTALANPLSPNSTTSPVKQVLVQDFNRILQGASIYDTTRFKNISLRSETQSLQARNPQGNDRVRLNRMLLEDAFPLELTRAHPSQRDMFATTQWSVVVQAGDSQSEESRQALEKLYLAYRAPLYVFALGSGQSPNDAEDAIQGFFSHILSHNTFHAADPTRGRFRSFLLRAFQNYVRSEWKYRNAKKRGGGTIHVPIDDLNKVSAEHDRNAKSDPNEHFHSSSHENASHDKDAKSDPNELELGQSPAAEEAYDLKWASITLEKAVDALKQRYADEGKTSLYAQLQPHYLRCTNEDYARIGAEMQMSPAAVATAMSRFRARIREALHHQVAQTVTQYEDVEDELKYLIKLLSSNSI